MIMKDINNKIHELIESAYMMGYEDGKNLEYDLGLNDAWECARKMMLSDEDGGIALSDILKIFGMTQYSAIKSFSATEAMAKIKEYEEKQKRTCDTCQYVGNTLYNLKTYCANCDGRNGWTPKQTEQRCKSKMTLDEAIKHCEEVADSKCDECGSEHRQLAEWLKELKELKELRKQEPCEDAISRQAVFEQIGGWIASGEYAFTNATDYLTKRIKDISPVTPQSNTGHWIETAEEYYKAINEKGGGVNENTPYFTDDIACSECLAKFSVIDNETERFICCPNCGAKMVESQERED